MQKSSVCGQVVEVFRKSGLRIAPDPEDTVLTRACLRPSRPAGLFVSIWEGRINAEAGMTLREVINQVCLFLDSREND